jgi:hypothetical protein
LIDSRAKLVYAGKTPPWPDPDARGEAEPMVRFIETAGEAALEQVCRKKEGGGAGS